MAGEPVYRLPRRPWNPGRTSAAETGWSRTRPARGIPPPPSGVKSLRAALCARLAASRRRGGTRGPLAGVRPSAGRSAAFAGRLPAAGWAGLPRRRVCPCVQAGRMRALREPWRAARAVRGGGRLTCWTETFGASRLVGAAMVQVGGRKFADRLANLHEGVPSFAHRRNARQANRQAERSEVDSKHERSTVRPDGSEDGSASSPRSTRGSRIPDEAVGRPT